jgi:serine O-acetyltransferase
VFDNIRTDIHELTRRESGVFTKLGVILLSPGLHAVLLYRAARWFHLHHLHPLAVLISYFSSVLTGAQLSARAEVGKGFVIHHPHGTSIGATTVIGEYCTLTHGNVIGQLHGGGDRPVIGDYFVAATGAKILGRIRIGHKVRVGPNAVVTQSLPDRVTVAGNAARIIRDRRSPDSKSAAPRRAGQGAAPDSHAVVLKRLVEVITNNTEGTKSGDAIGENTVLIGEGIGLDSIEMLHVISAIEEEFGLTIDEGDLMISHLQTVGSLAAFVEERLSR